MKMITLRNNGLPGWLAAICMLLFTACAKKDNQVKPAQPATGVVRPIGGLLGPATTKQIGADGGTIANADGSLQVSIPAGALTNTTTISLEPIENTNPGGIGTGYRLTPHGITFLKPVSITFSYAAMSSMISYPPALGIAYQDAKGIWQYMAEPVINTNNKSITINSTHFSDWTLMLWMFLTPQTADVDVNGDVPLKAVRVLPTALEGDVLVPLVPPEGEGIPVGDQVPLEKKYIKKWDLAGAGVLESEGAEATYFAPSEVPTNNPVAVTLALNLKSAAVTLVTAINITGSSISFRINGGNWQSMRATAFKSGDTYNLLAAEDGRVIDLKFESAVGFHAYRNGNNTQTKNSFMLSENNALDSYKCFYIDGEHILLSDGGITITSMGIDDGYITGTFTVVPSGRFSSMDGRYLGSANIDGKFRVKKSTL
ncbi:hypothetical protein [uncultured Chitinophaga sp.]|uniref:hypothetical protein n=1 Tax=uncultured Chitinophaga sp. TaxID=339340 RepID=UPI0025EE2DCC|nr:hypothetical protein [uncultured Chitinophaga sp.]